MNMHAASYHTDAAEIETAITSGRLRLLEITGMEYQLAQLYLVEENSAEAIRILERSIARPGGRSRHAMHKLLSSIYYELGRHTPAIAALEQGLEHPFDDSDAMAAYYQCLVDLYVNTNHFDKARAALEKMIRLFSNRQSYRDQLDELCATLQ